MVWREGPANPVIHEQVVLRAAAFANSGFDSRVVFAGTPRRDLRGGDLPTVHFEERCSTIALARLVAAELRSRDVTTILICRNSVVATVALLVRWATRARGGIIHDARGWYAGYSRDKGDGPLHRAAKRLVDRVAYRRADHTVVVSQALLGIALAYGADPASITVIPQFVPRSAPADPSELPPADVVTVTASAPVYQTAERTASLLESLAERLPDVRFGWLDGSIETDRLVSVRANLWRARVSPEAVQSVLAQAHAGLVIRATGAMAAASAPVKAAEYRAAGCAVITGPSPPSTAELAMHSDGEVVTEPESAEAWTRAVRAALDRPRPPRADYGQRVIDQWAAVMHDLVTPP
jgi:glycosyltransferase involved in cell wall biosynthesis